MPRKKGQGLQYLPTTGVRTDFKRFMNKFLSINTVRFEHFSEIWRERNMSYLCAARGTDREVRENVAPFTARLKPDLSLTKQPTSVVDMFKFIERVTMIAQEYFLPPYQFQVRVGGLYMLYSIYKIQPLIPKAKLRLTPSQWQDTMYFQQQAIQQNHLDVVYIFQRLLHEQAFLFCYTPSEMSFHSNLKDVEDREEDLADNLKEEKTAVVNLFNYESLEKLSYFQDQYQQMKIGLAGQNATKPDKSLDVVQGELAEDIVVLLQAFKEKVATFSKQGQRTESTSQDKEQVPETTLGRRQQLKTQAYSQLTAHPDKRHTLKVVNNSTLPKAKSTNSEAGAATKEVQTGAMKPVTKESKRPILDVSDSSSTDDTDDDYIPPKNKNSDSKKQIRDKKRSQQKGAPASDQAKVMKQVTSSSLNIKDLKKAHYSMPVLSLEDTTSVPTKKQNANECTSEVSDIQTKQLHQNKEHSSQNTTATLAVPVRKRGRPRAHSNSNEINVAERGRPRAHCNSNEINVAERGRPRAHSNSTEINVAERGRPRAHCNSNEINVAERGRPRAHSNSNEIDVAERGRPRAHCNSNEINVAERGRPRAHCNSTEINVAERGRPREHSNSNEIDVAEEVVVGLSTQLHQRDKENPSQANGALVSRGKSNDTSNSTLQRQNHISLKNKVAFKWKSNVKTQQFAVAKSPPKTQNSKETNAKKALVPMRKRGRPRLNFDPTLTEIIVYPEPEQQIKMQSAINYKYEVLYFPSGVKLNADLKGANKFASYEANKVLESVQHMTSMNKQAKKNSEKKLTPAIENAIMIRHSANEEPMSKTVTGAIMTNTVQTPAAIRSATSHKAVNNPESSKSSPEPANSAIQRLKERCKRRLEESDKYESIGQFVKRCATEMTYFTPFKSEEDLELEVLTEIGEDSPAEIKTSNITEKNTDSNKIKISAAVKNKTSSNSLLERSQLSTGAPNTPTNSLLERSQLSTGAPNTPTNSLLERSQLSTGAPNTPTNDKPRLKKEIPKLHEYRFI